MHFQTERAQGNALNNEWDSCHMKFQKSRRKRKTDRERTHRDRESEWLSASYSNTVN